MKSLQLAQLAGVLAELAQRCPRFAGLKAPNCRRPADGLAFFDPLRVTCVEFLALLLGQLMWVYGQIPTLRRCDNKLRRRS